LKFGYQLLGGVAFRWVSIQSITAQNPLASLIPEVGIQRGSLKPNLSQEGLPITAVFLRPEP
jgi:hypothetical protein